MTKEVTIKKHNSLTDALTDLNLTSEKLLNALYLTWEREGYEDKTMTIPIADLKNIVGYNSNNDDYLYESLDQLTKSQRWRNLSTKDEVSNIMAVHLCPTRFIKTITTTLTLI